MMTEMKWKWGHDTYIVMCCNTTLNAIPPKSHHHITSQTVSTHPDRQTGDGPKYPTSRLTMPGATAGCAVLCSADAHFSRCCCATARATREACPTRATGGGTERALVEMEFRPDPKPVLFTTYPIRSDVMVFFYPSYLGGRAFVFFFAFSFSSLMCLTYLGTSVPKVIQTGARPTPDAAETR